MFVINMHVQTFSCNPCRKQYEITQFAVTSCTLFSINLRISFQVHQPFRVKVIISLVICNKWHNYYLRFLSSRSDENTSFDLQPSLEYFHIICHVQKVKITATGPWGAVIHFLRVVRLLQQRPEGSVWILILPLLMTFYLNLLHSYIWREGYCKLFIGQADELDTWKAIS